MRQLIWVFLSGILIISSCKTTSHTSSSHTDKAPLIEKAKRASHLKQYAKAIVIYDEILQKDSTHIEALLGKAGIFYTQEKWASSQKLLEKVVRLNPKYNPEVYFSLGLIYEKSESYEQAANAFKQYLLDHTTKDKKTEKANFKLDQNKFRVKSIQQAVKYKPELLDSNINTAHSEYWAVMNADNSSFVFTRRINHQEDLFISEQKEDGTYIKALAMPWNTPRNEAAHCISPDGNLIIFTRCDAPDSKGGCDLYYTQYKYGKWSKPKNMGAPINSTAWDAQPSLSSDGNTLYFSSKRKGTHGESDIFVSHLHKRRWSKPIRLSKHINTARSDESPYLHPDGQTLYFRSNGRIGMGSFDIYYSKKDPLTQEWTEAINIGYPINTTGEDGALTVAYDGKTAFYASDYFSKTKNTTPNLDIIRFELPLEARSTPVSYAKLQVMDAETNDAIKTKVVFYDLTNNKLLHEAYTDENGELLVSLIQGKKYMLNINKKEYSFYSEHLNLSNKQTISDPYVFHISLEPIKQQAASKSKEIILHNIFFESGSSVLLPSSMAEIRNLNEYLTQFGNKKIAIIGHTDNIGLDKDNLILSQERAKSVYQKLIDLGVEPTRLSYEGKGESYPIAGNNTAEGRKKNRRTSFLLL